MRRVFHLLQLGWSAGQACFPRDPGLRSGPSQRPASGACPGPPSRRPGPRPGCGPGFRVVLGRHIGRGTALIAVDPGQAGLLGGLLFSARPPAYHVRWLVVSGPARRQGAGRSLMAETMRRFVSGPGVVEVVTFGAATPVPRLAARGSFMSGLDSPRPRPQRPAPKAAPARSTARPSPDEAAPAPATRGVTLHMHTR
jgi:GNAT superfamily N-acetyltransferase